MEAKTEEQTKRYDEMQRKLQMDKMQKHQDKRDQQEQQRLERLKFREETAKNYTDIKK